MRAARAFATVFEAVLWLVSAAKHLSGSWRCHNWSLLSLHQRDMEASSRFEKEEVVNHAHVHVLFGNAFHCRANGEVSPRHLTQTAPSFKILVFVHVAAYSFSCQGNGTCAHRLVLRSLHKHNSSVLWTAVKTQENEVHGRKECNFS